LNYFNSTEAPASSSCFFISSASSFDTESLSGLGAPSTKSLASLSPNPVIALTALIAAILLSPAPVRIISNSVCSSPAASAESLAAGAAAAATGAAAVTPTFLPSQKLAQQDP